MASRLLCSRVRTVKEAYEVRRAATLAVLVGSWQRANSTRMFGVLLVHAILWGPQAGSVTLPSHPRGTLPLQEWYIGRWPSGPVVASIESIRKQPGQVLGHINSLAISKCRWLPELIKATVPRAGSEAEAIRRVSLVQQELKLTLSEMREACRALKAAADDDSGIPAGKLVPSTGRSKRVPLAAVRLALARAGVAVW